MSYIRLEKDADGIVELIFDQEGKAVNVMGEEYAEAMPRALDELEAMGEELKGLYIRSGKAGQFFAGGDITMMLEMDLNPSRLPECVEERLKARLLHRYSDATLGSGLREVIFEKRGNAQRQWDLQRIQKGQDKFYKDLEHLEKSLSPHNYFTADYTLADCAITARLGLAEKYKVPIPEHFSRLKSWFERMKQRPNYEKTKPV